jgi:hypothetical protein
MKPTRNLWLWIALEILLVFLAHWLLREMGRGFAGPRAWWTKFSGQDPGFPSHTTTPPSADVRNKFFRN